MTYYWEIQKLNGSAVNPYQYSSNPAIQSQSQNENPWVNYFNSNNSQQKTQVSTYDAIAQLNAMNEQQQVKGGKKLSPEEVKEAQKKAKAQKKLGQLAEQLQNNKELALTDKHIAALNMIQDCSPLMHLSDTLKQKIKGAISQSIFLIQKVTLTQMKGDMDASEILKVIDEVKQADKQLKQDWKKISSGIIKTGAYAEAYMKVDDEEKKEKYEQKAKDIVANLPDAHKNKAQESALEEEMGQVLKEQNSETEDVSGEETSTIDAINAVDAEVAPAETVSDANPFADTTDSKEPEVDASENNEDVSAESDNTTLSSAKSSENPETEEDSELKDLKEEVQKELKKQEQNPNSANPFAEYEKKKAKENKSVLGV